jgi:hypothetical protein
MRIVIEKDMDRMVRPDEAEKISGLSVRTLANRRSQNLPPTFYKVGGKIWYRVGDLEELVQKTDREPVKKP